MFLVLVLSAIMAVGSNGGIDWTPVSDDKSQQQLELSKEEAEFLQQLELLEEWDLMEDLMSNPEMERLLHENPDEQRNRK
jgi:hypothetical protein